jgi:glycosyltransferase involved in cell wall biosynthesis
LNILITNSRLTGFTGTEVVVRDLACELQRQGHMPLVYSPVLGAMAQEIRNRGIEVTNNLNGLSAVPQVIHGHHHPQVMEALLHFPLLPAIFVCHNAVAEVEEPFYFPRILRYVAVDNRCRARLENARNIPAQRIEVILNAVDLQRFQPRVALPRRPRRALVFSNHASRYTHLPAVRRACRRMGLEFDVLGSQAGTGVADPERVLPGYDLVFAKARCALEAMAAGTAVVLCDFAGAGPMVSSENFDQLRIMNFGGGVLVNPLESHYIQDQVANYDPADAGRVSQRVRREAGLEAATRRWIALYTGVVEEFRQLRPDHEGELRAVAAYLGQWNYDKGREPALEIARRIRRIPIVGNRLHRAVHRILRWTAGRL